MEATSSREEEPLDALRRRLYRRDATAADVRRYETALARAPAPPAPAPGPAPSPPGRRRRAVLIAAAVALGITGATAGVIALRDAPEPAATRQPSLLEQELAGPERPVLRLRSASPVQEFRGRGTGTAVLDTAPLPGLDGRLTLLLTLDESGPVRWSVLRAGPDPGRSEPDRVLVVQTRNQSRAVPVPVSFPYSGRPPTAVHVAVPDGVGWGLLVAPAG